MNHSEWYKTSLKINTINKIGMSKSNEYLRLGIKKEYPFEKIKQINICEPNDIPIDLIKTRPHLSFLTLLKNSYILFDKLYIQYIVDYFDNWIGFEPKEFVAIVKYTDDNKRNGFFYIELYGRINDYYPYWCVGIIGEIINKKIGLLDNQFIIKDFVFGNSKQSINIREVEIFKNVFINMGEFEETNERYLIKLSKESSLKLSMFLLKNKIIPFDEVNRGLEKSENISLIYPKCCNIELYDNKPFISVICGNKEYLVYNISNRIDLIIKEI